ncbi:MAG: biotin--[acetyl-CoA-carboxylase] ligase [Planctomycetota bacterium]|jgi:BirA family biotin operon repressor/biotin-[acetyl-CoA-carboxylase] ligase
MKKKDRLDPDKIKTRTKHIGRKALVYKSTSSTNDIAAEYAKNKKNHGLAVFAEEQTEGRGRTGNKWLTGKADSILCSIVLTKTKCNPDLLSLAAAVAVAEAIGQPAGKPARVKWPNDIILNKKKIAGVMLESKKYRDRTLYILGIGINCHQKKTSFPKELQKTATSIDMETRITTDRISLAKRLLTSLDQWLEIAERKSKEVTRQWRKISIQLGHRVTLSYNGKKYAGNCIGIDPRRGLILQLDSGSRRMFHAAQSTIVK